MGVPPSETVQYSICSLCVFKMIHTLRNSGRKVLDKRLRAVSVVFSANVAVATLGKQADGGP
jgi:hypothetical protein